MAPMRPMGVQSIERTIAIVRAVAQGQSEGARLVDIARRIGITKSTAHRILQALVHAGWIEQGEERGRFRLGIELYALGLAAASRHDFVRIGERSTSRLAEQLGDTVYFQVRMGLDSICLARCSGAYPVKILTVDVGSRQPLGMGAGNTAILAFLPDNEVERVIAANMDDLMTYVAPGVAFDANLLKRLIEETRADGHSLIQDLFIPGMAAVGMPIFGPGETPVGALSVAATTSRLQDERRSMIVANLRREVRLIEGRLKNTVRPLQATPAEVVDGDAPPTRKSDARSALKRANS